MAFFHSEDYSEGECVIIHEIYDSEDAHEQFEADLERALENQCKMIAIEPTAIGEETARWIQVGNCLHKTAVIAGLGCFVSPWVLPKALKEPVSLVCGGISFFCAALYGVSWQFDPCCKYQVEHDTKKLAKLPLGSLTSSSPIVLVRKDDKYRKRLQNLVAGSAFIYCSWKVYMWYFGWYGLFLVFLSENQIMETLDKHITNSVAKVRSCYRNQSGRHYGWMWGFIEPRLFCRVVYLEFKTLFNICVILQQDRNITFFAHLFTSNLNLDLFCLVKMVYSCGKDNQTSRQQRTKLVWFLFNFIMPKCQVGKKISTASSSGCRCIYWSALTQKSSVGATYWYIWKKYNPNTKSILESPHIFKKPVSKPMFRTTVKPLFLQSNSGWSRNSQKFPIFFL